MTVTLFTFGVVLICAGLVRGRFSLDERVPTLWLKLKAELKCVRSPDIEDADMNAMEICPNILLKYPPIWVGCVFGVIMLSIFFSKLEPSFLSVLDSLLRSVFAFLLITAVFSGLLFFASFFAFMIYFPAAGFALDTFTGPLETGQSRVLLILKRLPLLIVAVPAGLFLSTYVWLFVSIPTAVVRALMLVFSFPKFVPFALGIPLVVGALIMKFY